MTANEAVFLDANAIIYALDKTSEFYDNTVATIQQFLDEQLDFYTSHHVIEEVLHIAQKIFPSKTSLLQVVEEIEKIPSLVIIEPAQNLDFAKRYAKLAQYMKMGVNDALILQLMLDAGITKLFSYDQKFVKKAQLLDIQLAV